MKKSFLASAAFAAMLLASCAKEGGDVQPKSVADTDAAYMSITVAAQRNNTRASVENPGAPQESALVALYLVTFDDDGNVLEVPGTAVGYTKIEGAAPQPAPIKVSPSSTQVMVVANPGAALTAVLESLTGYSTYDTFNEAITGAVTNDIIDLAEVQAQGFTMISVGSDANLIEGATILNPFVAIGDDDLKVVGEGYDTEAEAVAAAAADRLAVNVERLASKLELVAATPIDAPGEDVVTLTNWTVDAVNTTFFPFAVKTILAGNHTPTTGGSYTKNFYTEDPNFTGDFFETGDLARATISPDDYSPILPMGYTWLEPGGNPNYVIENTMAKDDQQVGNSTRVIMKATYYPDLEGYTDGNDWFAWAGKIYASLADLQAAYNAAPLTDSPLRNACDAFYAKLKGLTFGGSISAVDFASLDEDQLNAVSNGGEVVKDGENPVIRWYQRGLCYYSYEVQHDNDRNGHMAYGKYGVVRNNWYDLTLASVAGPGTPWYPDAVNPGPGDPDPETPIDELEGYIGVTVSINNWVHWNPTQIVGVD